MRRRLGTGSDHGAIVGWSAALEDPEETMPASPTLTFHDGRSIPQLGYGVYKVDSDVSRPPGWSR